MLRLILIGFMGAGKTTLGKALAKAMNCTFIDLDNYIESRYHCTVAQIFERDGEEGFRHKEREMLHEVAEFEDVIISAGGGTPCFFDNMDYMNRQGVTIYLKATPESLFRRLRAARTQRPLLAGMDDEAMQQFIARSLQAREPFYNRAHEFFASDYLEDKKQISQSVEKLQIQLNLISKTTV